MSTIRGWLGLAGLAICATPALGQDRPIMLQFSGGGYSHMANLSTIAPNAHFKMGFNLGGAVTWQVSRFIGLRGDFTFASTEGLGAVPFAGKNVDRYFFGGMVELRYPLGDFAPFVFGGGGGVKVDQQGDEPSELFDHFTRGAGMIGGGFRYQFANSPFAVVAEGKALTYQWKSAGFDRNQWDMSYSLGFAYRFGF